MLCFRYCSVFKVQSQLLRSCWWAWEDSNLRPYAYQAYALTTWATSPCCQGVGRWKLPPPKLSSRPQATLKFSLLSFFFKRKKVVEMRRIELLTPCLQGRCSPSWATPPNLASLFSAILCCNCVAFRQRRLLRFPHAPCYASSCEKFLAIFFLTASCTAMLGINQLHNCIKTLSSEFHILF